MTIYQGVDITAFQGSVDWHRVKQNNIDFAMLRATIGSDKSGNHTDMHFHRNAHDAAEAGIALGAYHCSLAVNSEEARREAEGFLHTVSGYRMTYPVAIDVEDRALRNLENDRLDKVVRAWCCDLRDAGYYPVIRAQLPTVLNRLIKETLDEFDLWLIKYGETTDYAGDIGIWQYTGAGSVGGVRGQTGRLRALRNYREITQNKSISQNRPDKKAAESKPLSESPLTQAIDTLYGLAALSDVLKELFVNGDQKNKNTENTEEIGRQTQPTQQSSPQEPVNQTVEHDDRQNADDISRTTQPDEQPQNGRDITPVQEIPVTDSETGRQAEVLSDLSDIFTLDDETELCTASLADKT